MNDGKPDLRSCSMRHFQMCESPRLEAKVAALESENTALREIERRATEYVTALDAHEHTSWIDRQRTPRFEARMAAHEALAKAIRERTRSTADAHVAAKAPN